MSRFILRFVIAVITFTIGLFASVGFGWVAPAPAPSAQEQHWEYRSADKPTESRSCSSSRRRHHNNY